MTKNNKSARIIIHRGTEEIGGSITEIAMGNTIVWVDAGSELPGNSGKVTDADMIRLASERPVDAILFTHYHGDHVGLMDKLPKEIPIYMDRDMKELLTVLHKYTKNAVMQEILGNMKGRIHTFTPGEDFTIGDIKIIPFFVDHSAYHANMLLFECAGQTILHSGDFRSSGYLGKSVDKIPDILRNLHKKVDVLISEGTMLTRDAKGENLLTEWDLRRKVEIFLKGHQQVFVICSSTNFDSLTSICHAAKKNNLPIYANDYMREMLAKFEELAGKYAAVYRLPQIHDIDDINRNHPHEFILLLGSMLGKSMGDAAKLYDNYRKLTGTQNPWLIYSMWRGYLDTAQAAYNAPLAKFVGNFGEQVLFSHSSGHADRDTLAKFITDISPQKYILPLHTENAAGFKELDIEDKYKDIVTLLCDGYKLEID